MENMYENIRPKMAEKKTLGEAPKDLLAKIRKDLDESDRDTEIYPPALSISKNDLPVSCTLLNNGISVVEIPVSEEKAKGSFRGIEGYRKTPDGLIWDAIEFKAKHDGIEKRILIDSDGKSLREQMVAAHDKGEGKNVRIRIEMRASKSNPGQQYKAVSILGTED